jgi:hypothetical protein
MENNKKLQMFINDSMELEIDQYISFEIDDTHYIVSVGLDDEGFNCELLYSPEGVDDIAEAIFISKDNKNDLPQTIKYLISCVIKERE